MKAIALVSTGIRNNILFRFYKHFIWDSMLIVKNHGCKELMRRRGKKVFAAVFCYYLVRDTFLYIILPVMLGRSLF